MILVISPAKALDYETPPTTATFTQPELLDQSAALIDILREKSPAQIAELMSLSDPLSSLNVARYASWSRPFAPDNAKQAVLAFNGDVYEGLDAKSLSAADLAWAQDHLRILSGLYGVLRPLDLMQPYRLEMGTRLRTGRGASLYAWWGDRISEVLRDDLAESPGADVVVNLASDEYFKAVRPEVLGARIVAPRFEDTDARGTRKIVSFYTKRARGTMAGWLVRNRVRTASALTGFDADGYRYDKAASTPDVPVFVRSFEDRPVPAGA